MNQITMNLFKSIFQKNITVMLDWQKLEASDYEIEVMLFEDKEVIKNFYTPWHINDSHQEVGYDGTIHKPLSLRDVKGAFNDLNAKRQQSIKALATSFSAYTKPVELYVPLYKYSDNDYFILDANHKLSALMLTDTAFKIVAFVVKAPAQKGILQDLENLV